MNNIRGIVFDLYGTLYDVHSVATRCDEHFEGRGYEISTLWRQKQLEYTWLRSLMGRFADFEKCTEDALLFTCLHLGLELDVKVQRTLCDAYLHLRPYAEVPDALLALKARGLPLAILSNGTRHSIDAVVRNSGLHDLFTHQISVDAVRVFKPDARVYELAERMFRLGRESLLFVSSNAWDATGARYFGFETVWVNRHGNTFDQMGEQPDHEVNGLDELVRLLARFDGPALQAPGA
jgi:2-haloacid dehalogenase